MKKQNIFTFSIANYFIRFGIIELILLTLSIFFVPALIIVVLFLSVAHFVICFNQTVTLDPFQIVKNSEIVDGTPTLKHSEKTEKYYYINEMKNYKMNYMFITIYGNIDYRVKHNSNGAYEEKTYAKDKVRIHRTLKNEKVFLQALEKKN